MLTEAALLLGTSSNLRLNQDISVRVVFRINCDPRLSLNYKRTGMYYETLMQDKFTPIITERLMLRVDVHIFRECVW